MDRTIINEFLHKNNKHLISKGGDGYVYKITINNFDYAIKVLKKDDIKEILITEYAQRLYNKNIIKIYDYFFSTKDFDKNVMIMELMEGNLEKWTKNMFFNKYNFSDEDFNNEFRYMIFTISQAFLDLNENNILHLDAKPKNILFKKFDKKIRLNYGKKHIETYFLFKITDFGKAQIDKEEFKSNTDIDINVKKYIDDREDLFELSRILLRILVNIIVNKYDMSYFDKFKDNKFIEYRDDTIKEINKTIYNYPSKIKNNFLKRSLLYYLIENNVIKTENIIKKFKITYPNKEIQNIFDNLTNKDFDIFKII